jgi:hypothetical protein
MRTYGARGVLRFADQPRGHNDVGIHSPKRHTQLPGRFLAPRLRLTEGIFVPHDQRRTHFLAELHQVMVRPSPQDEADAAPRAVAGNISNALR